MAKVYLGLGTNLGDKEQNLRDAVQKIEEQVGKIVSLSAFYITAPWGFSSDNSFLNAAVCVDTGLTPIDVLQRTQAIEQELANRRTTMFEEKYAELKKSAKKFTVNEREWEKVIFSEPLIEVTTEETSSSESATSEAATPATTADTAAATDRAASE